MRSLSAKLLGFSAVLLTRCLESIDGELIDYNRHILTSDHPEYLIIPKFDKKEVPNWRPGNGNSYIDLSHLYIESTCSSDTPVSDQSSCKSAKFDLLMFEAPSDKPWQDYWENDHYCCTQELVSDGT